MNVFVMQGPQPTVYHSSRECTARGRYWSGRQWDTLRLEEARGRGLKPCRRCKPVEAQ